MAYYNEIPTLEGKIKDLERRMSTSETAPRLTASGVGSGGIKINDGGSLTIEDGGGVIINGGGNVLAYGGEISSITSDGIGYVRLINGQLYFRRIATEQPGTLRTDSVNGRTVLRLTPPTAAPIPPGSDFTTLYLEGKSPSSPGYAVIKSEGQMSFVADGNIFSETKAQMVIGSVGHTFIDSMADSYIRSTGRTQLTADTDVYIAAEKSSTLRAKEDWMIGGETSYLWNTTAGYVYLNCAQQMTARTPTFYVQGNLGCSGTKPFKIVHPLDDTKALVHAATESPVAGLEYWGEDVIGEDGTTVISLPDYFEALAAADWRGVFITPYGEPSLIAGSKIVDGQFTVTGTPGTEFSWLAKGRRGDEAGQFEVEPDRIESGIDADVLPPDYTPDVTSMPQRDESPFG